MHAAHLAYRLLPGTQNRTGDGMQLKGLSKVLLTSGAICLLFYGVFALYLQTTASVRTTLLFVALVGLVAGTLLYLLSAARPR